MLAGIFCLSVQADGVESVKKLVSDALPDRVETLDLAPYNITQNDVNEIILHLAEHDPFAFLMKSVKYSLNTQTNTVTTLVIVYQMSADEHRSAVDFINKKTAEYLKGIQSDFSDVDKLLFVHEMLIKNTKYDTSFQSNNIYTLFKTNTATCQGYSMAFLYLCREMGFEVDTVSSTEMKHMWNKVKLNGKWYNVDVTHDDPTSDRVLRANHNHFLCSDAKFQSLNHSGFPSGVCTDTSFDNAYWNRAKSLMVYDGDSWIFADSKESAMYSGSSNSTKKLFDIEKNWQTGSSIWPDCYTGQGIIDGKIIYNTNDAIMSYDPKTEVHKLVYTPQLGSKEQIFGLYCEGNTVYYVVATDPNGKNDEVKKFVLNDTLPEYYNITFKAEDEIISSLTVKEGSIITAPSTQPTKPSTSNGTYVFKGWSGFTEGMKASSDLTFEAVFEFVANSVKPTVSSTPVATTKPIATTKPPVTTKLPPVSTVSPTVTITKPTQPTISGTSADAPASTAFVPGSTSSSVPPASSVQAPPESSPIATPSVSSSLTVPGTTTVPATTKAPDYNYNGSDQAAPTHNIPQKSTIAPNLPAGRPSNTLPEASHGNPDEPQGNDATPWIIAGVGSALVVGAIVLKEMVIAPMIAKAKRSKEKDDQDKTENENNE